MWSAGRDERLRIDLNAPRHDQSTFWGRLRYFLEVTDVRTLFTSNSEVEHAQQLIADYRARGQPPVSKEQAEALWQARKVVSAIIHPDSGEKIPVPFRLSCFVPINMIIALGMLSNNPSISSVIFWQWVNQSYNLALNHANRNASNPLSNADILQTYSVAVGLSCSVAVGLGQLVKNASSFKPSVRATVQRFVPYTAVATAGIANVFLMRWNELREGIIVRDENGNELGRSQKAGLMACSQVALSRCLSSLPCLTVPPLVMSQLEQTAWLRANSRASPVINLGLIAIMLWTALPAAVAVFPQQMSASPKALESHFHNLKDHQGNAITRMFYNRGL